MEISLKSLELSDASYLARAPMGIFCLADGTRLVFFDEQGRFLFSRGGSGEGPGEFSTISALTWSDSDQAFLAYDAFQLQVSAWKTDGSLISEKAISNVGNPRWSPGFQHFGRYYYVTSGSSPSLMVYDGQNSNAVLEFPFFDNKESVTVSQNGHPLSLYYHWDDQILISASASLVVTAQTVS